MILERVPSKRPGPGRRGERGAAAVEFALVAMMLIVLLMGMWDFGRLLDAWVVTTNAAREGARYGAIYGADTDMSDAQVISEVQQKAYDYLVAGFGTRADIQPYSFSNVTVSFPTGRIIGQSVQVTVWVQVQVFPPIRDLFFGGSSTAIISRVATMRI